ncbi:MAG: electron transfer flavoprotein subunit beta/FixA family protein [Firmicutes bacterium]|nr:electron transfer flavoprotein subunit beta/FixA family protein [Bacillota bacterium]
MNIVVCVKQTVDLQQVRIRRETREPVLENIPLTLGNIDKNALEEGVRLREQHGGRVVVVSAGSDALGETIKEALAMGADEAVLVTGPQLDGAESAVAAEVLARAIGKIGEVDLILLGEGSGDNYSGQVGPRLAELLGMPQVGFVNGLQVEGGRLRATRSLEDCLEVVEVEMPAVVAVVSEINEARIPAVTAILKAGRKPKQELTPGELGFDLAGMQPRVRTLSNLAPEQERKRILFSEGLDADVDNLIKALLSEGAAVR